MSLAAKVNYFNSYINALLLTKIPPPILRWSTNTAMHFLNIEFYWIGIGSFWLRRKVGNSQSALLMMLISTLRLRTAIVKISSLLIWHWHQSAFSQLLSIRSSSHYSLIGRNKIKHQWKNDSFSDAGNCLTRSYAIWQVPVFIISVKVIRLSGVAEWWTSLKWIFLIIVYYLYSLVLSR